MNNYKRTLRYYYWGNTDSCARVAHSFNTPDINRSLIKVPNNMPKTERLDYCRLQHALRPT